MLRDTACPTCGAPGLEPNQPDGVVICKFCGNKFDDDGRVACPNCESLNGPEADFCQKCGEKLKRSCPACATENWAGAEYCISCGRDLDVLSFMAQRQVKGFRSTLEEQRKMAGALKDEQEAQSQKRLAEMWETEKRRQEFLTRQVAGQRRQQATFLGVAIVIAVLFIMALAVMMFFALTR